MPSLVFKPGVQVNAGHFRPHVRRILDVALLTAPAIVDDQVVVTSANDGKHQSGSRHYDDAAWDFRCWNVQGGGGPGEPWASRILAKLRAQAWARSMQNELGPDYDLAFEEHEMEMEGGSTLVVPHIHAEWRPVVDITTA